MIRRAMKNSKFTCLLMPLSFFKSTLLIFLFIEISCGSGMEKKIVNPEIIPQNSNNYQNQHDNSGKDPIIVGANQFSNYYTTLRGKKIGIVANQTSVVVDSLLTFFENPIVSKEGEKVEEYHLVDFLLAFDIDISSVFAPEHGFRGTADAGEVVKDGKDNITGLPVFSLYGKNKKPTPQQLKDIDIMVFDIQDVGARFYTYISTLHYIMEACAENNIPLLILDRPNPNGHFIDGPILEQQYKSFVGMHPVPVVHGMTIGEYAQMINGEEWLANGIQCDITIVKIENYTHQTKYSLPIKPSPNLPNDVAINLYPSLCFFEGTLLSAGRGTEMQFQVFGAPSLPQIYYPFTFTPQTNEGAKYPKFINELCYGKDLRNSKRLNRLNLEWLIEAYVSTGKNKEFFTPYFTKLAGTTKLQELIEKGYTYREIRKTWLQGLEDYDKMRSSYLLYER